MNLFLNQAFKLPKTGEPEIWAELGKLRGHPVKLISVSTLLQGTKAR
jgi:hypothetical protein